MKKIFIFLLMTISLAFAGGDKVGAYLQGSLQDVDSVKSKLTNGGFVVLSSSKVNVKGTLTTIVFTDNTLIAMANKNGRGFMSTLRVLIDEVNSQISFTNPIYFAEAFMQGDNDKSSAKAILAKITAQFSGLKESNDNLKYDDIADYHFMFGMPYYDDMDEVAKASSSEELLSKIKSQKLVFTQKLSNDRILVGVKLSDETSTFIEKIGVNNALVLPYPILLENGKAKILAPKYYLAISYPLLKMSQFMKISDVPGAIVKDCKDIFK